MEELGRVKEGEVIGRSCQEGQLVSVASISEADKSEALDWPNSYGGKDMC